MQAACRATLRASSRGKSSAPLVLRFDHLQKLGLTRREVAEVNHVQSEKARRDDRHHRGVARLACDQRLLAEELAGRQADAPRWRSDFRLAFGNEEHAVARLPLPN